MRQLGAVAEDRLATAILLTDAGIATVAFPLVDLGFDLYPRRIRTLRAHPVQVKARSFLEPVDAETPMDSTAKRTTNATPATALRAMLAISIPPLANSVARA